MWTDACVVELCTSAEVTVSLGVGRGLLLEVKWITRARARVMMVDDSWTSHISSFSDVDSEILFLLWYSIVLCKAQRGCGVDSYWLQLVTRHSPHILDFHTARGASFKCDKWCWRACRFVVQCFAIERL